MRIDQKCRTCGKWTGSLTIAKEGKDIIKYTYCHACWVKVYEAMS